MCFSLDGEKKLLLQVKSLSKRNPVPLGNDPKKFMGDYWIIVTEAVGEKPTCYLLTPNQVKCSAHRGEKNGKVSYWLQPKQYATEDYLEKWDLIGRGC